MLLTSRRLLLVSWLCIPTVAHAQNDRALAARIDAVLAREPAVRAHWGIAAADAATGAALYARNADRLFIPASITKLVAAAAAAHYLPADFRYATTLYATGPIAGGVLSGDLILYGRGDPLISARYQPSMLSIWESLADSLRAKGVQRISGSVVADESHWDTDYTRGDWEAYDLLWWYAAPVSALGFNDNSIDFTVRPGALGAPTNITWQPQTSFFTFINRTTTVAAGARHTLDFTRGAGPAPLGYRAEAQTRGAAPDTIVAYGAIPLATAARTEYFAVTDPARYAATVFRETLERKGIVVGSRSVPVVRSPSASVATRATALVQHHSQPLPRVLAPVLQTSQNWIAEQLLKTIAREVGGEGSWEKGLELQRRFLRDVVAIDSSSFQLRDASGLSVGNLLTPNAFLRLLRYMAQTPRQQIAIEALPVAAAATGSLRRRFEDLSGRVAAKTGSLRNADSLAGFVTTAGGRRIAFVVMVNASGRSSSTMRPLLDDVVRAIAADTTRAP